MNLNGGSEAAFGCSAYGRSTVSTDTSGDMKKCGLTRREASWHKLRTRIQIKPHPDQSRGNTHVWRGRSGWP